MKKLTKQEIRERFETSRAFNVVFDAFEQAIEQRIDDIEMYRFLFWNKFLSSDELCLFGEKLSKEFPHLSFDAALWLATVFAVTYSTYDNFELAMMYYKKAAGIRPSDPTPYLDAADCYEPDIKIPPPETLVDFLKHGLNHVQDSKPFYRRLIDFYEEMDNDEMSVYYRRKLEDPPPETPDPIIP